MSTTGERVVPNVTCLGCGCACDDIVATVRDGRITAVEQACDIGRAWFGDGTTPSEIRVDGAPVSLAGALDRAAELLLSARRPCVFLAPELSCEAQRAGVALADLLRAFLDTTTSLGAAELVLVSQRRGRALATFAELRHRADVVLYWGVDPVRRHPRFLSRVTANAAAMYVNGARRVLGVDVGEEPAPRETDLRVRITPDEEPSALAVLTALVRRRDLGDPLADDLVRRMSRIADVLLQARYVGVIHDVDAPSARLEARAEGLIALTHALNTERRAGSCALRAGGNRVGADAVLAWQTGFPMSVDFSGGAPRYRPPEHGSGWLDVGDVDVILVAGKIGDRRDVPALADGGTRILIGPQASESAMHDVAVSIDTGTPGIHEGGTAIRVDEIPLPLRQVIAGPLSTTELLHALAARVRALPEDRSR